MKTHHVAGEYELERQDGSQVTVHLSVNEARMLFKLFEILGFVSMELVED